VAAMIRLYCHGVHGTSAGLCADCGELLVYANRRLDACPFQEGKTTCAKCPAHCYQPRMRDGIRAVMRYAGPRMLYRHPVLAVRHLLDSLRAKPIDPRELHRAD
jgi:predicted amidophosphoribosyltransferase